MPGVLLSAASICAILATLIVGENPSVRERLIAAGGKVGRFDTRGSEELGSTDRPQVE